MNLTRIIVISDTHGNFNKFYEIVKKHMTDAYCFIHLGDGYSEFCDITNLYPELKIYGVRGNNDFFSDLPAIHTIEVCSKTIAFTHGHNYFVKSGLSTLINAAKNICADIVLYGHTHKSFTKFEDGLYIMNPGAATFSSLEGPSYGIIDLQNGSVVLNIVKI